MGFPVSNTLIKKVSHMSAQKLGLWLIPDVLELITKVSHHITRDLGAAGDDDGDEGHGESTVFEGFTTHETGCSNSIKDVL